MNRRRFETYYRVTDKYGIVQGKLTFDSGIVSKSTLMLFKAIPTKSGEKYGYMTGWGEEQAMNWIKAAKWNVTQI